MKASVRAVAQVLHLQPAHVLQLALLLVEHVPLAALAQLLAELVLQLVQLPLVAHVLQAEHRLVLPVAWE